MCQYRVCIPMGTKYGVLDVVLLVPPLFSETKWDTWRTWQAWIKLRATEIEEKKAGKGVSGGKGYDRCINVRTVVFSPASPQCLPIITSVEQGSIGEIAPTSLDLL